MPTQSIHRLCAFYVLLIMFSSGFQVNQILCCIAWRPDWAVDVINLAHERRNNTPCAVVGVDIAAGEEHFDKV